MQSGKGAARRAASGWERRPKRGHNNLAPPLADGGQRGYLRSITAPFKARALLKAKKPVTIQNKWSGRDETALPDGGLATAVTTYKLKLKPVN